MVRRGSGLLAALLLTGAIITPAMAADLTAPPPPPVFVPPAPQPASPYGILSEARFGLLAHGVANHEWGSVDINGELLSVKPVTLATGWANYFIPRFHVGGDLNTAGRTNDVYTGLTWTFPIYGRLFGEATFGGSYNDGHTGFVVPKDYSRVGCHTLFRESVSLGYHIDDHWNVMALAEHDSNAGLCKHNEGLTNIGLRLGYVF